MRKYEKIFLTVAGVLIVILAINTPYLYRLKISVENEAAARVEKAKVKAREDSIAVVKAKAVADSIEIANKKRVALEDSLRHKRLAKEPNPFYFDFEERFGIIEPFARDEKTLREEIPNIKNLSYHSCLWYCPRDTCRSYRVVMALRCPDNSALLSWMSRECSEYVKNELYLPKPKFPGVEFCDADALCSDVIDYVLECYTKTKCVNLPEVHGDMNEQNGLLITDIFQTDAFCTFFKSTWYDMMSCGCPDVHYWYSVDKNTGKALKLSDIVSVKDYPELYALVLKHLHNWKDYYVALRHSDDDTEVPDFLVNSMSGCALLQEGLIVYYAPYSIGIGAEGEFYAVVPYKELRTLPHGLKVSCNNPQRCF